MERSRKLTALAGGVLVGGGVVCWMQFEMGLLALVATVVGMVVTPLSVADARTGAEAGALATLVATLTFFVGTLVPSVGRVESMSSDGWPFMIGFIAIATLLLSGVFAAVLILAGAAGGRLRATREEGGTEAGDQPSG